ncbi:MAG: CAP domain-containing protein [Ruminococcus sp.]|nr:CAP domain-containing protein [Ruminococcus sp.]
MKRTISVLCLVSLLVSSAAFFANAQTRVLPTDVGAARKGCVLVGIKGSYITNAKAAVDRINALRKEACSQGIKDPRDKSRKLTINDYKPIRWSSDLEYIARIRAAEASIITEHTRPNGDDCFSVVSPNGVVSSGEVLAWNFSDNLIDGIEQWYEEKYDWVNNTGGVTGHYTQMIDPDNQYVGLGDFNTEHGAYRNCTSGEFSVDPDPGFDTAYAKPESNCIQTVEIQKSLLGSLTLNKLKGKSKLYAGSSVTYEAMYEIKNYFNNASVCPIESVTWSSSNKSTAVVENGTIKCLKAGQALITATLASGDRASVRINVLKNNQSLKIKSKPKKIKAASLKNKSRKIKRAVTVKNNCGKVTYKLVKKGTSKLIRSKVSVSKNGVITLKKSNYKKGTYTIKMKITAAGNTSYAKTSKNVKIKIKIV